MIEDYSKLFNRDALEIVLLRYKKKILKEMESVNDLMSLLMKGTRRQWTKSELLKIKTHFIVLGKKLPIFLVFMLPGGTILLPLLVEVLDRRKKNMLVVEDRRKAKRERRVEKVD